MMKKWLTTFHALSRNNSVVSFATLICFFNTVERGSEFCSQYCSLRLNSMVNRCIECEPCPY